jgi:CDP-glycerol glycerophosphotransferase (TagB/SpsB family)
MGANRGSSFVGNPKYFYLHLINAKNREFSPCWITGNKKLYNELKERKYPVLYKYSITGYFKILRSKFLIIEQMPDDIIYLGYTSFGRFNYIQTFHGISFKKIGNDAGRDGKGIAGANLFKNACFEKMATRFKTVFKNYVLYKYYRVVVAQSDESAKIIKSAFSTDKTEVLGYPRDDIFFNPRLIYNDYKKILDLGGYSRVITYVPTFRDNYEAVNPFTDDFLIYMDKIFRDKNYLFLVKKHQYENRIQIQDNLSNIKNISHLVDDIQELLYYTDILVTDYSSVFIDFIFTDRPIIFYPYDYEKYLENCRSMYYDYYGVLPGPFAKEEKELLKLILDTDVWFAGESYQKEYYKMKTMFNYFNDGDSSRRLLDYLSKNF